MPVFRRRRGLEHLIDGLLVAMDRTRAAEATAGCAGLLQRLDPRVKLFGILFLIVASVASRHAAVMLAILGLAIVLTLLSFVPIRSVMSRVWIGTFALSSALALPAVVITPGHDVVRLPWLDWPVTPQGLTTAGYLVVRTETAATLAALLVFTTPWAHVLKALRTFRVPVVFVVVLGMTYRYILLLLETTRAMFEARRSRTVGRLSASTHRRLAAQGAGVLLGNALDVSGQVFLAMQARGFRGEVHLLDDFRLRSIDWTALALLAVVAAWIGWMGR